MATNNDYVNNFKREHYDRIVFLVPKGKGKLLKDLAADNGISVSRLIIETLETGLDIDLSK